MQQIKPQYILEGNRARLTKINGKIACTTCGVCLALKNGHTIMLKSQVALIEPHLNKIILRCGKCRNFTTSSLQGEKKELLSK